MKNDDDNLRFLASGMIWLGITMWVLLLLMAVFLSAVLR